MTSRLLTQLMPPARPVTSLCQEMNAQKKRCSSNHPVEPHFVIVWRGYSCRRRLILILVFTLICFCFLVELCENGHRFPECRDGLPSPSGRSGTPRFLSCRRLRVAKPRYLYRTTNALLPFARADWVPHPLGLRLAVRVGIEGSWLSRRIVFFRKLIRCHLFSVPSVNSDSPWFPFDSQNGKTLSSM